MTSHCCTAFAAILPKLSVTVYPHKNGVGTLWPNLNRLSRFVPCGKEDFTFTIRSIEFLIGAIGSQELSRFQICPRTISWARLGGPNFTQSKMSREHVLRARLLFVPRRRAPRRPGGWRSPPWRCRKQPSRACAACAPCTPSKVAASVCLRCW